MSDIDIAQQFANFLSWGQQPIRPSDGPRAPFAVPPAWYAYAFGLTTWCPPKGEL